MAYHYNRAARVNGRAPCRANVELTDNGLIVGVLGDYVRQPDAQPWVDYPAGWARLMAAVWDARAEDAA